MVEMDKIVSLCERRALFFNPVRFMAGPAPSGSPSQRSRLTLAKYRYSHTDREEFSMAVEKVTFTLPEELVRRLERVPAGKRSLLVKKAVEKELDREAALSAAKKMKGRVVWKEKMHPDLITIRDFARYRPIKSRVTG